MPSKKPVIAIRTDENTVKRFQFLCDIAGRSMSNYGERIIKEKIKEYESEHGEIKIKEE